MQILKDDEVRKDYDYMLDHPEQFYYNYYKYYRRRVGPQVDIRLVVIGTIVVISIVQVSRVATHTQQSDTFISELSLQYISSVHKYTAALDYLSRDPKYRMQAERIAKEEGKWLDKDKEKRKMDKVGHFCVMCLRLISDIVSAD